MFRMGLGVYHSVAILRLPAASTSDKSNIVVGGYIVIQLPGIYSGVPLRVLLRDPFCVSRPV